MEKNICANTIAFIIIIVDGLRNRRTSKTKKHASFVFTIWITDFSPFYFSPFCFLAIWPVSFFSSSLSSSVEKYALSAIIIIKVLNKWNNVFVATAANRTIRWTITKKCNIYMFIILKCSGVHEMAYRSFVYLFFFWYFLLLRQFIQSNLRMCAQIFYKCLPSKMLMEHYS